MMQLQERSYTNGHFFRPKPVIIERPESHLLVIATPWGPVEAAQQVAETVVAQFEILSNGENALPIENFPSLSPAANRLRAGVLAANQELYRNDNAKLLKSAVELTVLHYEHDVLSWVHVGGPHLILEAGGQVHPLAYEPDLSSLAQDGPLFSQALGMDPQLPLHLGSQRLMTDARLLMVARSTLPPRLFQGEALQMEEILNELLNENAESPFWCGLLAFEVSRAA